MNQQSQCISVASQLLQTMRGERGRIQWLAHPDRTAVVVKLAYLSDLPTYSFAECIKIGGAAISYFERGLSSTQSEWSDLKNFLELDNNTLFRRVELPEGDEGKLRPKLLALLEPAQAQEETETPEISSLIERVATLRKGAKRINWAEHPQLLEDLKLAWKKWTETDTTNSFCDMVGIHRDVLSRHLGGLKPKAKTKAAKPKKPAKKPKKATAEKATAKKPVEKPATQPALQLPVEIKFTVEDDSTLVGHCEIRLKPGTPRYAEVLRQYIGGDGKVMFNFN